MKRFTRDDGVGRELRGQPARRAAHHHRSRPAALAVVHHRGQERARPRRRRARAACRRRARWRPASWWCRDRCPTAPVVQAPWRELAGLADLEERHQSSADRALDLVEVARVVAHPARAARRPLPDRRAVLHQRADVVAASVALLAATPAASAVERLAGGLRFASSASRSSSVCSRNSGDIVLSRSPLRSRAARAGARRAAPGPSASCTPR